MLLVLLLQLAATSADTLVIRRATTPPVFDGRADSVEYGSPTAIITKPGGVVRLWLRRSGESVYLAAELDDSSFYWGDDLVIGLDTGGDRASTPQHDDFQWYLRRVTDSSIVYRGRNGTWEAPRDDPDWRLGSERTGGGWELRSVSDSSRWSLELRLDGEWFAGESGHAPGFTVRTYDDAPHGWFVWPERAALKHPTELERRPDLWGTVVEGPPGPGTGH
ncbi:MAG: hypothetical protein ABJD11_14505 [Gemmatimonadota bacterium]